MKRQGRLRPPRRAIGVPLGSLPLGFFPAAWGVRMSVSLRSLLVCLCLILAAPAFAEREVHVLAVGKGHQTSDFYALPEARVEVDRPGQEVALVLLDGGTLHWRIEPTPGTFITEILRSGPAEENSRVSLSGIRMAGVQKPGLPMVYRARGRNFRLLLDRLQERLGIERIHGFQAMHQMRAAPIRVDRVDGETPELQRDYLVRLLATGEDVPAALRNWTGPPQAGTGLSASFDPQGISLRTPGGVRRFPVTPDVPGILLPVAAVHDPEGQVIYGLTYGAEGYIYAVDMPSGQWSVVANLQGYDAGGLLFDQHSLSLVTTGAFSRPGEIRVFGLDGSRSRVFVPVTGLPGLTDLFDYGNEPGPTLTPLGFREGWLLAEARAKGGANGGFRLYAIEIATGAVRLLRYRDE